MRIQLTNSQASFNCYLFDEIIIFIIGNPNT